MGKTPFYKREKGKVDGNVIQKRSNSKYIKAYQLLLLLQHCYTREFDLVIRILIASC